MSEGSRASLVQYSLCLFTLDAFSKAEPIKTNLQRTDIKAAAAAAALA